LSDEGAQGNCKSARQLREHATTAGQLGQMGQLREQLSYKFPETWVLGLCIFPRLCIFARSALELA
jgi:hypothetical protein